MAKSLLLNNRSFLLNNFIEIRHGTWILHFLQVEGMEKKVKNYLYQLND